ncbi:unnamed protein product [Mytilus coruscus]|uniref:Sushi domain-containing protein n=1 Tax=Mytilus coruscus TaxID=42192 RepID=A0A6J8EGJ6_MYTCO|nr:unnamed protein product [Mytilus coruscus]
MWRLVFIILLFKTFSATANYIFNTSRVTWEEGQKFCNVPSKGDIMYMKRDYTNLPEIFTAWTSSKIHTSYWTFFHGCLDVAVKMVTIDKIKKTLNQYFPNTTQAIKSESVFKCAYFCTGHSDYFTFFKNVCKCIHQYELTSQLVKIPLCYWWDSNEKEDDVDKVFLISRETLPIFKFKTDFRTKIIQNGGREPHKHHCLANRNGTLEIYYCKSEKNFSCEGGYIGYGTWTTAIYKCLLNNQSLLEDKSDLMEYWLRYFRFEDDHGIEKCVAVERKNMSRTLIYQFRPCSDLVLVLCKDERESSHIITPLIGNDGSRFSGESTESIFDRTMKPSSTNSTDHVQRPGINNGICVMKIKTICKILEYNSKRKHIAVQLFSRKKTRRVACQTVNKKFSRNIMKKNRMDTTSCTRQRNKGTLQNENEAVPAIYNEPWELRRNIVHMGELHLQDVINVQTEETETFFFLTFF